ncbi:hypothetical protein ACB092_10G037100 [Castanea dentata]
MERSFNKRVCPRELKVGDLVLKEIRASVHDPRRKFKPNWSRPLMIKEIYPGGGTRLNSFVEPTNLDQEG